MMKWLYCWVEIINFDLRPNFRRSFPVISAFPSPRLLRILLSLVDRQLRFFHWSTSTQIISKEIRKPSFVRSLRGSIPQYWLDLFIHLRSHYSFRERPDGCFSLSLFGGMSLGVRRYQFWRTLIWEFCRGLEGTWRAWRYLFCWHWATIWYGSLISFCYSGSIPWQARWSLMKQAYR